MACKSYTLWLQVIAMLTGLKFDAIILWVGFMVSVPGVFSPVSRGSLSCLPPTLIEPTCLSFPSSPEELDKLVQMCCIRVGGQPCRKVDLQDQS